MFKLVSTDDGHELPFEYMPCSAITPKYGMAMKVTSGKLAIATGETKPTYICAREESAAVAAGTVIPVVKVQPDQRWKVQSSSSFTVGSAYTLGASTGLDITTTTTNGVFTVDRADGDGEVYGRFL